MPRSKIIASVCVALFFLSACGTRSTTGASDIAKELTDSLELLCDSAVFNGFGVALVGPAHPRIVREGDRARL